VGRYLVDAPTTTALTYVPLFDNEKLRKTPGGREDAKKAAEEKARELQAAPHETKGSMYIQTIPLSGGGWLVQGWKHKFSLNTTMAYLYIPIQTQGKFAIYLYSVSISSAYEHEKLRDLVAFGSSFRPLPEGVIPQEPGFCLEDVIIVNVPESITERLAIRMDDPHAKGLVLSFTTYASGESRHLWLTQEPDWSEEICSRLGEGRKCDRLRFGRHDVGPIQGEELCIASRSYDERYHIYDFEWANPGIMNSRTSPHLDAALLYRYVPRDPSVPIPFSSDAEALAVWDRLVNSIRIRPVSQ
jgi:hypothetical protein